MAHLKQKHKAKNYLWVWLKISSFTDLIRIFLVTTEWFDWWSKFCRQLTFCIIVSSFVYLRSFALFTWFFYYTFHGEHVACTVNFTEIIIITLILHLLLMSLEIISSGELISCFKDQSIDLLQQFPASDHVQFFSDADLFQNLCQKSKENFL